MSLFWVFLTIMLIMQYVISLIIGYTQVDIRLADPGGGDYDAPPNPLVG